MIANNFDWYWEEHMSQLLLLVYFRDALMRLDFVKYLMGLPDIVNSNQSHVVRWEEIFL